MTEFRPGDEVFSRSDQRYDLLVDIAGSRSSSECRRALAPKGTYVVVGGPAGRWLQPAGHMMAALASAPFVSQRVARADVLPPEAHKQNLATLTELIEGGEVAPIIDRRYPFEEIPEAVRYQEMGHAPGKVVVTIGGWGSRVAQRQ